MSPKIVVTLLLKQTGEVVSNGLDRQTTGYVAIQPQPQAQLIPRWIAEAFRLGVSIQAICPSSEKKANKRADKKGLARPPAKFYEARIT